MSRDKKPVQQGRNVTKRRPVAKPPARRFQDRGEAPPPAAVPTDIETLARGVFQQLLEQHVNPEAIVDGLDAAGLEPEMIEALLTATRACVEIADSLPEETEELEFDDLMDTLIEVKGVDPDIAEDVVEAFFSLGEEA